MPEKKPARETVIIFGNNAKLFRDGDHPVYILEDGRFAVFKDGLWKGFKSLAGIDKKVAETRPVVKLVRFNMAQRYGGKDEPAEAIIFEAVAWVRGYMILANGERKRARYSDLYLYNEAEVTAWHAMQKKRLELLAKLEALETAHEKAFRSKRVSEHNFKDIQGELCPPK